MTHSLMFNLVPNAISNGSSKENGSLLIEASVILYSPVIIKLPLIVSSLIKLILCSSDIAVISLTLVLNNSSFSNGITFFISITLSLIYMK